MSDYVRFLLHRVREMLWVKPLVICLISIAAAFLTKMADQISLFESAPKVTKDSLETLLSIISSSMLVIAVFAVGSMLSAYQSASNAATPRSFTLVIADDVSQNALSTFIGAFIFSIVAQIALMNGYYGDAGRFALFAVTLLVFALVILSFIRWVDRIARLGRMGTIVEKVERATEESLCRRLAQPLLRGTKAEGCTDGQPLYSADIGYIQRIDMAALQSVAVEQSIYIEVASLPGKFATPDMPLMYVRVESNSASAEQAKSAHDKSVHEKLLKAFVIGKDRTFDEDPRFGLVVLSEIASRALSPAVNDPGTAIEIIGSLVRLLTPCSLKQQTKAESPVIEFDRVAVPDICLDDFFDDAFNPIARDGAAMIEVVIRLHKALCALAAVGDDNMKRVAIAHAQLASVYAQKSLSTPEELERLSRVAEFCK